ncbi:hypothetical protein SeMB42_g03091 [Synchytrium endobioticum]|uniref:Peptidase A1 domain-containing protein n=1 Tax=Synchytrium endobioticum TaxID=286115 RepID=A0A507DBN7_9FUNG|nr:hypothetical protein SeMB42_g03091 [Synchytrium endobioticum]
MRVTGFIVSLLSIAGPSYAAIVRIPTTLNPWTSGSSGLASTGTLGASVKLATSSGLRYNGALVGQIKLGTPAQTFTVILDTGSQTFWVRGANCTRSNSCLATDSGYNAASSSTFKSSTSAVTQLGPYGDGLNAFGLSGIETMGLAAVTATNMPFYYAINVTTGSSQLGADGIMGIPAANGHNATFDGQYVPGVFAQQKLLDSNIWAFWYNNTQTTVGNSYLDGQLSLGGIDTALYTGSLLFVPLLWDVATLPASLMSLSAFWFVSLTSISVGSAGNVLSSTTAPGYAGQRSQSGYQVNKPVAAIASALKGKVYTGPGVSNGFYGPNCNELAYQDYPNITFTLGGVPLSLPPKGYTIPDSTNNYCNGFFIFQASLHAPLNGGIMGNLQQSNYYNVFDWSGRKIGFAPPSSNGAGAGTSFTTSPTQSGTGTTNSSSGRQGNSATENNFVL